MLQTAQEFLNMVTVNKDMSLGKWDRDHMTGMIPDVIRSVADMPMPRPALEEVLDAIEEKIPKKVLEFTNLTLHFIIQGQSMVQYISPYNKVYHIGKTHKGVTEQMIWIYRPEFVKVGYIKDETVEEGRNHSLKEHREHEFGTCEDKCNIVALHTYEFDKNKGTEFSDVHIVVLVPAGNLINEISMLNYRNNRERQRMEKIQEEVKHLEKKSHNKKGRKVSGPGVRKGKS